MSILAMNAIQALTIFHDPRCALCRTFRQWLENQARWIPLEFIDCSSEQAERRFPGIAQLHPERDIVVVANDGRWWQGAGAWLLCLWATRDYRAWSFRLANPMFYPLVRKAVFLISQNRFRLSRLLNLKSDQALMAELQSCQTTQCKNDSCSFGAE